MAKELTVKDLLDNTRLKIVTGEEYLDRKITKIGRAHV